jgi:hypothetical protein
MSLSRFVDASPRQIPGDIESVPAGDDADAYVVVKKKAEPKEEKKEEKEQGQNEKKEDGKEEKKDEGKEEKK